MCIRDSLLGVLGKEDDPARVEGVHDIRVVALDAQRAGHRAAGHVEHHGHARARLHGQLLQGVEQAVGAGGVEHPGPAGGRAVADARGAVLALGGQHADAVRALAAQQVQLLGDLGAVSYTHLDVYKRQAGGRAGGGRAGLTHTGAALRCPCPGFWVLFWVLKQYPTTKAYDKPRQRGVQRCPIHGLSGHAISVHKHLFPGYGPVGRGFESLTARQVGSYVLAL